VAGFAALNSSCASAPLGWDSWSLLLEAGAGSGLGCAGAGLCSPWLRAAASCWRGYSPPV